MGEGSGGKSLLEQAWEAALRWVQGTAPMSPCGEWGRARRGPWCDPGAPGPPDRFAWTGTGAAPASASAERSSFRELIPSSPGYPRPRRARGRGGDLHHHRRGAHQRRQARARDARARHGRHRRAHDRSGDRRRRHRRCASLRIPAQTCLTHPWDRGDRPARRSDAAGRTVTRRQNSKPLASDPHGCCSRPRA